MQRVSVSHDLLSRYAATVISAGLRILLIVLLAVLIQLMMRRAITRFTRVDTEEPRPGMLRAPRPRSARARTIGSVLRSGTTFVVFGVAGTLVLGELGINLGPIIASAGILGVALGFGAQNLVKDFLSGMFMMVENQYDVGDVVDFGAASGTVERVGLRVTSLRDVKGTVWYVRNGEVSRVGNSSQDYSVAVVDLPVGHAADIPVCTELAERTATELTTEGSAWAADVLEPPQMLGVESVSAEGMTLRITAKVRAGRQWAVQRALRAAIMAAFAEARIPPPAPANVTATPS